MVIYGITLVSLVEELWAAYPGLIPLLYVNNAAFDGSERSSAHILKLLMERGTARGYFRDTSKSLFITDTSG